MLKRGELATFLRTRRQRLRPADVGLPAGGRRRTPGLRRQEVAELAGISVDYYIRLEQARGPHPSRQVLTALGRALVLTADEREYLFRLAGESPPPAAVPSREISPGIRNLLDSMPETPAYVVDAKYDVLAWNSLATLVSDTPVSSLWNRPATTSAVMTARARTATVSNPSIASRIAVTLWPRRVMAKNTICAKGG